MPADEWVTAALAGGERTDGTGAPVRLP